MMPSPNQRNPSELAMDSGTSVLSDKKGDPSGTPTPERPPSAGSPGSPVSDDTCPICLGHIQDKCVADSCLHSFCLVCLKEWAKQKAVCPLCKLNFTKIMHDIKSETEYKEWKVPPPDPIAERSAGIANFQEYLDAERRRFFGYRTTNFPGAATLRRFNPGRMVIPDALPSGPRERRPSRYNLRGSSMFRLSVYLNNVWVQPIADITGRYRQTSPELYREQPALTHRLVPWINRELAALLPSSRIGSVLTEIMDLIERYPINSREFRRAVQPHLGRRTNHFIHEFYHFARSPYDMIGHDNASHYVPRYGFSEYESSSSSSDDDSDAVVEVDATGNPINNTSNMDSSQGPSSSGNVIREEILTQEGSVVISSDDNSSSDSDDPSGPTSTFQGLSPSVHNPEPPSSLGASSVRKLIGRARQFLSSVNEGASTSRTDESTGINSQTLSTRLKKETVDSDDSDACIILDELPPKKERTPELINLDSDDDEPLTSRKESHWKKKLTEEFNYSSNGHRSSKSDRKGKKKPQLKRNNFALGHRDCDSSGPSTSRSAEQDHSYCTEDGNDNCEPSSSNSRSRNSAGRNSRDSAKRHDNGHGSRSRNHIHLSNVTLIYSDEDESLVRSHTCIQKHSGKYKDKHSQRISLHERNTYHSRSRSRSPSRERTKRVRKDHRSKVKNSSRSNLGTSDWHNTHYDNHRVSSSSSPLDSWEVSDYTWSPMSSGTAHGSSQRDQSWDSAPSHDSSFDSRDSNYKEWKSDKAPSKAKKSAKKKKKSKHRHKYEKLKKSRRSKKKKKVKSKKSYSSSSSYSDSEDSGRNVSKSKRTREHNQTSTDSDSVEQRVRKKSRRLSSSESS